MYRSHGGSVRAFVHRRVPREAADDLVADVFVAAWRRVDEAPADALPWLLAIARGLIANRRRGETRRRALRKRLVARGEGAQMQEGPEQRVSEGDAFGRAFGSLGERDREVIRLIAWDGLGRPQAAEVLGVSEPLFSVQLHRARRRLKRALEEQETRDGRTNPSSVEAAR